MVLLQRRRRRSFLLLIILIVMFLVFSLAVVLGALIAHELHRDRDQDLEVTARMLLRSGQAWLDAHPEVVGEGTQPIPVGAIVPAGYAARLEVSDGEAADGGRVRLVAHVARGKLRLTRATWFCPATDVRGRSASAPVRE